MSEQKLTVAEFIKMLSEEKTHYEKLANDNLNSFEIEFWKGRVYQVGKDYLLASQIQTTGECEISLSKSSKLNMYECLNCGQKDKKFNFGNYCKGCGFKIIKYYMN